MSTPAAPKKVGRPPKQSSTAANHPTLKGAVDKPQNDANDVFEFIMPDPSVWISSASQIKLQNPTFVTIIADSNGVRFVAPSHQNTAAFSIYIPAKACVSYFLKDNKKRVFKLPYTSSDANTDAFDEFVKRIPKRANIIIISVKSKSPDEMDFTTISSSLRTTRIIKFEDKAEPSLSTHIQRFESESKSDVIVPIDCNTKKQQETLLGACTHVEYGTHQRGVKLISVQFDPSRCCFRFVGSKKASAEFTPISDITDEYKKMPALDMSLDERYLHGMIKFISRGVSNTSIKATSEYFMIRGTFTTKNAAGIKFDIHADSAVIPKTKLEM